VRNAMQNTNDRFDWSNGYVNHVCGLHNLWRKALRPGNGVVVPIMMHGERKASGEEG